MNGYMKVIINAIKQWVNKKFTVLDDKLNNKVDKIDGKGLSTNDYTNEEKNKLVNIEDGANKIIVDTILNNESENPVQNKVVKEYVDNQLANRADKEHSHEIAEVTNLQTTLDEIDNKASTMIVTLSRKTESQSESGATTYAAASEYEVDKSFDEIMAHINNGGTVLLYDGIGIIGNIYMNLMFVEQEIGILMFNTLMVNSTDSSVLADVVNPIGVDQYTVLIQQGVVLVQKTVVDLNSTELLLLNTTDKTIPGAINELNSKLTDGMNATILISPNGTRFNIKVGDDGVLTSTEITE